MTVLFAFVLNAGLLLHAMDFGVSLEVWRTRALGSVVETFAQGVEPTRTLESAGVAATPVDAGLVEWAVGVGATSDHTPVADADLGGATVSVDIAFFLLDLT